MKRHWVPLDVNYADDAKILAVSPGAELLYIRGLALASRLESDGFLCARQVTRLRADITPAGIVEGMDVGDPEDELVREGLWEDTPDPRPGYRITAWADWNVSSEERQARRAKASEDGRRGARRRWGTPIGDPIGEGNGESIAEERTRARGARASEPFEAEFEQAWAEYPRKESRKAALRAYQARRREGVSAQDLALATENYAADMRAEGRSKRHMKTGATFYGPNEHWKDHLGQSLEADDMARQTVHATATRICERCGAPRWIPGIGPVSCNCPPDDGDGDQ